MFWHAQLVSLLHSHLLISYVDGALPSPLPTLTLKWEGKDVKDDDPLDFVPNSAYFAWCQQDQASLSVILGSLTLEVDVLIMFATMSCEAWTTLSMNFSLHSHVRVGQLRSQLPATKKEGSSIQVFFNKIKTSPTLSCRLAALFALEEFVSYVTDGHDEDYDALIETILGRTHSMPVSELFSRLSLLSNRLLKAVRVSSTPSTLLYAGRAPRTAAPEAAHIDPAPPLPRPR
jgi:hypothetical protein